MWQADQILRNTMTRKSIARQRPLHKRPKIYQQRFFVSAVTLHNSRQWSRDMRFLFVRATGAYAVTSYKSA
jgi:hypothetical protein